MNDQRIIAHVDPDLEELIPGFLDNRRRDVEKLRAALAAGDFATVRITGHSMKGAGGGYGFQPITDIGAVIERAAMASDAAAAAAGIDDLAAYLARVEVVYDGAS